MQESECVLVFDPRGRVEAELVAPAARVAALEGLRLGILDNTKWNAGRLLRKTASLLGERHISPRSTTTARKVFRKRPTRR